MAQSTSHPLHRAELDADSHKAWMRILEQYADFYQGANLLGLVGLCVSAFFGVVPGVLLSRYLNAEWIVLGPLIGVLVMLIFWLLTLSTFWTVASLRFGAAKQRFLDEHGIAYAQRDVAEREEVRRSHHRCVIVPSQ